jgi:hypothetical protein
MRKKSLILEIHFITKSIHRKINIIINQLSKIDLLKGIELIILMHFIFY